MRSESLAFQVEAPPRGTPERAASAVLRRAFPGETWTLKPLNEAAGEFEAVAVVRGKRRSPPLLAGRQGGSTTAAGGGDYAAPARPTIDLAPAAAACSGRVTAAESR